MGGGLKPVVVMGRQLSKKTACAWVRRHGGDVHGIITLNPRRPHHEAPTTYRVTVDATELAGLLKASGDGGVFARPFFTGKTRSTEERVTPLSNDTQLDTARKQAHELNGRVVLLKGGYGIAVPTNTPQDAATRVLGSDIARNLTEEKWLVDGVPTDYSRKSVGQLLAKMGWSPSYCTSALSQGRRVAMYRGATPPHTDPILTPKGIITIRRYYREEDGHLFMRSAPRGVSTKPATAPKKTTPPSTTPTPAPKTTTGTGAAASGVPGSAILPQPKKKKKKIKAAGQTDTQMRDPAPTRAPTPDPLVAVLQAQLESTREDMQILREQNLALQTRLDKMHELVRASLVARGAPAEPETTPQKTTPRTKMDRDERPPTPIPLTMSPDKRDRVRGKKTTATSSPPRGAGRERDGERKAAPRSPKSPNKPFRI
eukprot:TRINITY_DN7000_c0_g1_i2.p1 TRINITY_DN7000_c0_g1~~TRINITY_DN7000_c0_g1_i2.p1  ORF type:complete len:457 (-),score=64.81 TRINITY_DN7000_c0_g1_i2:1339-2622(-)